MEKIGVFNLEIKDVKCSDAVRNAIVAKAKQSAKWNDIPGNHRHYPGIEKVFNKILTGGSLEEVRAVFKEVQPPASLSQVGLVFPPVIWESLGRGERCEAVKDETGALTDRIDWELTHDMKEPESENVVQAWLVTCMSCGKEHIVREVTSTLYCTLCKPRYTKGRAATAAKVNVEFTKKGINRMAKAAGGQYKDKPEMQAVIADRIDSERAKLGLEPMSKKVREAGPKAWTV